MLILGRMAIDCSTQMPYCVYTTITQLLYNDNKHVCRLMPIGWVHFISSHQSARSVIGWMNAKTHKIASSLLFITRRLPACPYTKIICW